MSDAPNPRHLEVRFSAELPASGLPARFGIVTAYNPGSRVVEPGFNERADEALEHRLVLDGFVHFRVTGGSSDGSHREPGYGIVADSPEEIRPLSKSFHQEAFFWVENGAVFLINTEATLRHPVAPWADRAISARP